MRAKANESKHACGQEEKRHGHVEIGREIICTRKCESHQPTSLENDGVEDHSVEDGVKGRRLADKWAARIRSGGGKGRGHHASASDQTSRTFSTRIAGAIQGESRESDM